MNAEETANSAEEIERLRARLLRLADEKSNLQLIVRLIEQLNPLPGIQDMVRAMLHSIVETIGGTDIKLYYWIEGEIHYAAFLGESQVLTAIDDPLVVKVAASGEFVEESCDTVSALLQGDVAPGAWTWVFPLLVGKELIGVIKLENLHLSSASLRKHLPIFFSHAALILSNEIRNYSRKKAEDELIERSEELDAYFNNALDLFCIADINGYFRRLNRAWQQTLGYDLAELEGKRFTDLVHPDDFEATRKVLTTLDVQDSVHNFVNRYRHKDGSYHWIEWRSRTHGQMIFAAARDITKLKESGDKINELNRDLERRVSERTAQLEASNKELEAFSYSVSHDLRTPLRAIDGFSHILLDDYADKLDDEGKRLLNVVRDNTNRMGQLIDDILKFSRTGRMEMIFSEIDMVKLAQTVFEELKPTIDSGKLKLEIEHIPPAKGDVAMIHQVFVNLLSNAIKFSRAKEPAMIKLGGSIEGDEAIYYVKDNGAGFDMQFADKLFGVFQRLHSVNEFEGTGIGLAIVKRIITRHGGRVWAEGKINEGATIYFALPTREADHG